METYHIFAIKKEIYKIYKNNEYALYKLLYNLKNLNQQDINYGITLYNQICNTIKINKLEEYLNLLNNIRKGKNRYMIKEKNIEILIIKPSNITYQTEEINNNITYVLNNYYKYLFICNFNKKEYKWVNNIE